MPIDCVSIDTLLIQVAKLATLITNIFGIGTMNIMLLTLNQYKCV